MTRTKLENRISGFFTMVMDGVEEIRRIAPAWVTDSEIAEMLSETSLDPTQVKERVETWWRPKTVRQGSRGRGIASERGRGRGRGGRPVVHVEPSALSSTDAFMAWLSANSDAEEVPVVAKKSWVSRSSTEILRPPDGYVPPEVARQRKLEAQQPWQRRYAEHLEEHSKRRETVTKTTERSRSFSYDDTASNITDGNSESSSCATETTTSSSSRVITKSNRLSLESTCMSLPEKSSAVQEQKSDDRAVATMSMDEVLPWTTQDGWRHGLWRGRVDDILRCLIEGESAAAQEDKDEAHDSNGDWSTLAFAQATSCRDSTLTLIEVENAVSYYYLSNGIDVRRSSLPRVAAMCETTVLAVLRSRPSAGVTEVNIKQYFVAAAEIPREQHSRCSHSNLLSANLLKLWGNNELTDVEICVANNAPVVRAHSAVLSARSSLMASAIVQENRMPQISSLVLPTGLESVQPTVQTKRIDLSKYALETVRNVLNFLYIDELLDDNYSVRQLCDMMKCAQSFMIPDLFSLCENRVALKLESLSVEESLMLFAFATKHDSSQLLESIVKDFAAKAETPDGINALHCAPKDLVTCDAVLAALTNAVAPHTLSPLMTLADKFDEPRIRAACLRFSLRDSNKGVGDVEDFRRLASSTSLGIEMLKTIAQNRSTSEITAT